MTMREKQILDGVLGIQKKIGGEPRIFSEIIKQR